LEAPKNPETDITFKLYTLVASENEVQEMRENYLRGNFGYGTAKQALFEKLWNGFAKEREIFNFYMENDNELEKKLKLGEEKAKVIAEETIQKVRKLLF
jgi:tryptophanyl-tRNA synthetase